MTGYIDTSLVSCCIVERVNRNSIHIIHNYTEASLISTCGNSSSLMFHPPLFFFVLPNTVYLFLPLFQTRLVHVEKWSIIPMIFGMVRSRGKNRAKKKKKERQKLTAAELDGLPKIK